MLHVLVVFCGRNLSTITPAGARDNVAKDTMRLCHFSTNVPFGILNLVTTPRPAQEEQCHESVRQYCDHLCQGSERCPGVHPPQCWRRRAPLPLVVSIRTRNADDFVFTPNPSSGALSSCTIKESASCEQVCVFSPKNT